MRDGVGETGPKVMPSTIRPDAVITGYHFVL